MANGGMQPALRLVRNAEQMAQLDRSRTERLQRIKARKPTHFLPASA